MTGLIFITHNLDAGYFQEQDIYVTHGAGLTIMVM